MADMEKGNHLLEEWLFEKKIYTQTVFVTLASGLGQRTAVSIPILGSMSATTSFLPGTYSCSDCEQSDPKAQGYS